MSEQAAGDLRPWVPEGARGFRVGDRVRVRLSGECRLPLRGDGVLGYVEHYPYQDGLEGTIDRLADWWNADPSHPYFVLLPETCAPAPNDCVCRFGGTFAPSELELLTPAPEPPTAHQTALWVRGDRESTPNTPNTVRAREAVDSAGEGG